MNGLAWRLGRELASLAPRLGIVPPPPARPEGLTALVRVAGEEEWIAPSLASLAGFADEVLLLDHGAGPETLRTVRALSPSLGAPLRRLDCTGQNLPEVANRGLAESRFRWAFLWDADFVARTDGPAAIGRLKRALAALDARRYHLLYVRALELAGDLRHRFPDARERWDPHVLTAGGTARYVWRDHDLSPDRAPLAYRPLRAGRPALFRVRYDTLQVPKYYRVARWPEACLFHVNVKSGRRMLLRHFWLEWFGAGAPGDLEGYARRRIRDEWGLEDLGAAVSRFMAEYCRPLEPVDEGALEGYPASLAPYLEHPAFRVLYEGGRIVGRSEAPGPQPC